MLQETTQLLRTHPPATTPPNPHQPLRTHPTTPTLSPPSQLHLQSTPPPLNHSLTPGRPILEPPTLDLGLLELRPPPLTKDRGTLEPPTLEIKDPGHLEPTQLLLEPRLLTHLLGEPLRMPLLQLHHRLLLLRPLEISTNVLF